MRTSTRLAIAIGLLCAIGALAFTFLPASSANGASCGTWVAPEMSREEVADLVDAIDGLNEVNDAVGAGRDNSGEAWAHCWRSASCSPVPLSSWRASATDRRTHEAARPRVEGGRRGGGAGVAKAGTVR